MGEKLPKDSAVHTSTHKLIWLSLPLASLARAVLVCCPQYDNRADDLTKEGMLKGIEQAAAFLCFLSPGVLNRPYCQMEIRHALALSKPIVLIHGKSQRNELM